MLESATQVPNTRTNSQTRVFFQHLVSINKEKLSLTCNFSLYIRKRKKTQQIQPMIFKLEFPLRFCFLAFLPQCLFSLSVLNTFSSRNSTQLHRALALYHRDWADPFWELECAMEEKAGTDLLYCRLCTRMV